MNWIELPDMLLNLEHIAKIDIIEKDGSSFTRIRYSDGEYQLLDESNGDRLDLIMLDYLLGKEE